MALFNNKKVEWAKVDPKNPENKYQSTTEFQWSLDVVVTKEEAEAWISEGLAQKLRPAKSQEGMYAIKLKRGTKWGKSGDEKSPVTVVDAYGDAVDGKLIGNGTTCNIQYNTFDTSFGNKSAELIAVQVIDLVKYEGAAVQGDEFSFAAKQEVSLEGDVDLTSDFD